MVDVVYPLSLNILNNIFEWYNIMQYVYSSIQMHGSYDNHEGLTNMSASADVFFNIVTHPKAICPGVFCFVLNIFGASRKICDH